MNGRGVILTLLTLMFLSSTCQADTWKGLRTSGAGAQGWQALICENGSGWKSCELPVNVSLTASPPSLVANGQYSTITATVTDNYGVPISNNTINWSSSDGSISAGQTVTNASGVTSISLRSSWTLGGAQVSASTLENDGSSGIWVPFVDSFIAYPSSYTGWANNGGVYSCSGWSPDPSTVDSGVWFTQWATCWQGFWRYRQDRQQSIVTGAVTNVGGPAVETTSWQVGVSQGAVGTKWTAPPPPVCWSSGNHSGGVNQGVFWDGSSLDGQPGPTSALILYYNGSTGMTIPDIYSSMVYNGMRMTVGGLFYTNNLGKNMKTWNYQICQQPL